MFSFPTMLKPNGTKTGEMEEERSASWSELFFDLVFAAIIAAMGEQLQDLLTESKGGEDKSPISQYAVVYLCVYFLWMDMAQYASRFNGDDFFHRRFFDACMIPVSMMACQVELDSPITSTNYNAFAWCLGVEHLMLGAMQVRTIIYLLDTGKMSTVQVNAFKQILVGVVFCVSVYFPEHRPLVWWISVSFQLFMSSYMTIIKRKLREACKTVTGSEFIFKNTGYLPFHVEHLNERMGGFVLIVLAESVNGVSKRPPEVERLQPYFYGAGFVLLSIAVLFKFLYFDVDEIHPTWHAVRSSGNRAAVWLNTHVLLVGAVAIIGSTVSMMMDTISEWDESNCTITEPDDCEKLEKMKRAEWLFCASVGASFFLQAMVQASHGVKLDQTLKKGARSEAWLKMTLSRMWTVYYGRLILQVLVSIFIAAYPVIEQDWDAVKPGDAPPKELVFTMVLVWLLLSSSDASPCSTTAPRRGATRQLRQRSPGANRRCSSPTGPRSSSHDPNACGSVRWAGGSTGFVRACTL